MNELEKIIFNKNRTEDFIVKFWDEFYNCINGACNTFIDINGTGHFGWRGRDYTLDADTFIEAVFSPLNINGEVVCTVVKAIDPELLNDILTTPTYNGLYPFNKTDKNIITIDYYKDKKLEKHTFPPLYDGRLFRSNILNKMTTEFLSNKGVVWIIVDNEEDKEAAISAYKVKYAGDIKHVLTYNEDIKEIVYNVCTIDELYYPDDSRMSISSIFNRVANMSIPTMINHMQETFQIKFHNPDFDWKNIASNLSYGAYYNLLGFFYSKNRFVANNKYNKQLTEIKFGRSEFNRYIDIAVRCAYINVHEGDYLIKLSELGFVEYVESGKAPKPCESASQFYDLPDGHWTLEDYENSMFARERANTSTKVSLSEIMAEVKANIDNLSPTFKSILKVCKSDHYFPYTVFKQDKIFDFTLAFKPLFNKNNPLRSLARNIERQYDVYPTENLISNYTCNNIFEWFGIDENLKDKNDTEDKKD